MVPPEILLLADSRLPSGGHGHSGGVEMAVTESGLSTVEDLGSFLRGRLLTVAPTQAGFAAAACALNRHPAPAWAAWDDALSARTPSAALRAASRKQGATLLRTATRIWRTPALRALTELGRPHQPLVLGAACSAGGGTPLDAAALTVHHLIAGACSAALRLLGLDPLGVASLHASLGGLLGGVSASAERAARQAVSAQDPDLLPAVGAPLPDILAAVHAQTEVTLFAS